MFPSPEYIQECIKNQKVLREERKRLKCGDWVLCWDGDEQRWGDEPWLVLSWYCEDALDVMLPDGVGGPVLLNEVIPLFQPRQLRAMLERQGRFLMFNGPYAMEERRYQVTAMAEDLTRLDARIDAYGPDPETALLRAYLEVVKDEKENSEN